MNWLRRQQREWRTGWAFALPGFSALAIVMGFPLVYALVMALSSQTLLHPQLLPLKGLDNFITVMSDPGFWGATRLTVIYSVVTVAGEFVLGLGIALMLNRTVKMKPVYFALLTIPMAMSPVSVSRTCAIQPSDRRSTRTSSAWFNTSAPAVAALLSVSITSRKSRHRASQ